MKHLFGRPQGSSWWVFAISEAAGILWSPCLCAKLFRKKKISKITLVYSNFRSSFVTFKLLYQRVERLYRCLLVACQIGRERNQTFILKAAEQGAGLTQHRETWILTWTLNGVEQKEQPRTTLSVFIVYLIAGSKQQELTASSSVPALRETFRRKGAKTRLTHSWSPRLAFKSVCLKVKIRPNSPNCISSSGVS